MPAAKIMLIRHAEKPSGGIQGVAVKKMRLSSRVNKGDRITLEADASSNSKAVLDLLDRVGTSVPLHLYNVTLVELAALFGCSGHNASYPQKSARQSAMRDAGTTRCRALHKNIRRPLSILYRAILQKS